MIFSRLVYDKVRSQGIYQLRCLIESVEYRQRLGYRSKTGVECSRKCQLHTTFELGYQLRAQIAELKRCMHHKSGSLACFGTPRSSWSWIVLTSAQGYLFSHEDDVLEDLFLWYWIRFGLIGYPVLYRLRYHYDRFLDSYHCQMKLAT